MEMNKNDLFDNPMVTSARNALTPEQIEEYKKMGEYMYNNVDYKNISIGSQVKEAKEEDLLVYAVTSLKSGCDPNDLTKHELKALNDTYGEKWYEKFDLEEHEVPKNTLVLREEDIINEVEKKAKKLRLSHEQRQKLDRELAREKLKVKNKK
jgi:hypothetical protein